MSTAVQNHLVDEYLKELRAAARGLPRSARSELVASIEEHITEALAPEADEVEVRTALDRLGDPQEIVQGAYDSTKSSRRLDVTDWSAILLLLVGGVIVPVIGWIIGVILLWRSHVWTVREKLIGTLLVPGGLSLALILSLAFSSKRNCFGGPVRPGGSVVTQCTGGHSTLTEILLIILLSLLVITPITTAIYLARRVRMNRLQGTTGNRGPTGLER